MMTALASVVDAGEEDEIKAILDQIADPVGTLHRFSLAKSTFEGVQS
jgi:hypothetical protein